jgi:restriction endonuclease S subunit
VTNDFPLFDVDVNKINPYFLLLITTTKEFIQFAQSCSSGTTNRQRMDIDMFLNQTIPLPELTEQNRIVRNHRAKIELSQKLQFEAQMLEEEIEHYFLGRLGLPPLHLKLKQITLQITDYASLDRWDFFSTDTRILIELKKSDFELSSIGKSYRFAKRSFNRARYLKSTFKYIEIGAIDPIQGILEAKDIEVKNTPSRATQIVKEGDLIIGLTRPYLKKFAIVTEMYDSNVCSSGFSIIEKSDRYHLPYLQQFLKCVYGIEQLKNKMTGGLYPAITEGQLKEIKIPLPEIKIQKDIMESIDRKKAKIVKNRVLSASVIHDAVQEFETIIFK